MAASLSHRLRTDVERSAFERSSFRNCAVSPQAACRARCTADSCNRRSAAGLDAQDLQLDPESLAGLPSLEQLAESSQFVEPRPNVAVD